MSARLLMFLLGRGLLFMGAALCVPLLAYMLSPDGEPLAFAVPAGLAFSGGLLLSWQHPHKVRLGVREGALLMLLAWLLLAFIGMLPYVIEGSMGWLDAAFESISNFTTTGASCATEPLTPPLLLWRSITECVGGLIGMVLLVTVMPQVSGCFGISFSTHQSISLSPMLNRMRRTGGHIAGVYAGLTVAAVLLYRLSGLGWFDALNWGMITLSTSGCYETSQALMAHSLPLEMAAIVGMLFASGNFFLYWSSVKRRSLRSLFANMELRTCLAVMLGCGLLVSLHLWYMQVYDWTDSFRYGFFQVVSFASTTGFEAVSINDWPDFDKYILFLLAFTGGCIGSTTGGFKVLRIIILFRAAFAEMRRTLHPRMIVHISVDGIFIPMEIVIDILGFFFLYLMIFLLFVLLIAFSGTTLLNAMGIAAACINSMGSAAVLYGTANDFAALPAFTKFICCFLMILGKVEIFSFLLVLQSGVRRLHQRW